MIKKIAVLRFYFLIAILVFAQNLLANDKSDKIHNFVKKYHKMKLFNGSVLVAESDKVIYKQGFGYANMEWNIPNTPDTKFRIGSVTKQFTAVLILKLAEEGKINLEGKITDYIPDYPTDQGNKVTIHHLLTHTSGIPSYTSLPNFFKDLSRDPYKPEEFLSVFSEMDFEFEPGTKYRYNNSGYFLLGAIIEKVTGQPYDEILHERIIDPLGLENSGYEHYENITEKRASGYRKVLGGYQVAPYLDTSLPYSAGMMFSTVEDLFKWNQILYTDKLFNDQKYKELMFTPNLQNYGYGWIIRQQKIGKKGKSVNVIEHGGGIHGFSTGFRRLVDDKHAIVIMDNTSGNSNGRIMNGIVNILYDEPVEAPKMPIAEALLPIISSKGIEKAISHYHKLKKEKPDSYNFAERELNNLGYHFLNNEDLETAIAIFKLNVEVYPEAFNTYDSLGEAYKKAGNKELAIKNYQKSVELNPRNEGGKKMLKELGVEIDPNLGKEITLSTDILQQYVGKYELRPNFIVTISLDGDQLKAQATGQPAFEIFAQSETKFFTKAFPAQMTFNLGDSGKVDSLTLHQNGQNLPAKKIE